MSFPWAWPPVVANVISVFGRTGVVVAALGDYAASLITNDSTVAGATVKDALNTLAAGGVVTPTNFAWSSNAATLDVANGGNFVATNTLTGNSTLTLSNGVDGAQGDIYVKQDGTGGRTMGFTVSGRTILRETGSADSNPQTAANSLTGYTYEFRTINSTAYVVIQRFLVS